MNKEINRVAQVQIEKIGDLSEQIHPLVVIRCITYNHEPYIREALEGFVMQKTDFPFVVVIHDDASTDGTASIIREYAEKYPHIIFPIFESENQYSKRDGSLRRIMNEACEVIGAKYIAMCEGDDYWIDPLKLQRQIDFLEKSPNYGMCYTRVERHYMNNDFVETWGGNNESLDKLLIENTVPTLTVVLRWKIYKEYINEINPFLDKWLMGDIPLWLFISGKSKVKFMDSEPTGVYRVIDNSVSHSKDSIKRLEFGLNGYNIYLFFADYFKRPKYKIYLHKYWDFIKYFIKRPHRIPKVYSVFVKNKYRK